jgi:hypothetical protein
LEPRVVLSPAAVWVGQDGTDLVGTDSRAPNGYVDVHIQLSGLDTSRTVARVDVQRHSGGAWVVSGAATDNAALVRPAGSSVGDLYIEPYFNDPVGVAYDVVRVTYTDGTAATVNGLVSTTPVDPNLRDAGQKLIVRYLGQDGPDLTSPGLAAGSDGIKDVHLALSGLLDYARATGGAPVSFDPTSDSLVVSITTTAGSVAQWVAGQIPASLTGQVQRAEFIASPTDPSRGDLYFSPAAGIAAGSTISVGVSYASIGKRESSPDAADPQSPPAAVVTTAPDPTLAAVPPAAPTYPVVFGGQTATWAGQDGASALVPGLAHVTLAGLPAGWSIADLTLSDDAGQVWTMGYTDPAHVLSVRKVTDPTRADLAFPPTRNEAGAVMTVRLSLNGSATQSVRQFAGGISDPALRDPLPGPSTITVGPADTAQAGEDLQTLLTLFGTVHLRAGVYPLNAPLDLTRPVNLVADPGAELLFSQPAGSAPWSYAIKLEASHITIDGTVPGGLSVRFATPVAWVPDFQYDPAVIGSAYGPAYGPGAKVRTALRNLDVRYDPSPADLSVYGLSDVRLIRSGPEDSGAVSGDTFRGGIVELSGGPWLVAGNDMQGADPGEALGSAFVVHAPHDVTVANNHVHQVAAGGATFGLLTFTDGGFATTVQNNLVDGGVGRDAAVSPFGGENFSDVILTESYGISFEGLVNVAPASPRLLSLPVLRGGPVVAGDVVAILSGAGVGTWVRVAQVVDDHTLILAGDLPAGSYVVSVTRGYVNTLYQGNKIDASSLLEPTSLAFRLNGPQFGTTLSGNTTVALIPFDLSASPTEGSAGSGTAFPVPWGWSHTPVLGMTVVGNTFRDPSTWVPNPNGPGLVRVVSPGKIYVEHDGSLLPNSGRQYLVASFTNNLFVFSISLLSVTSGNLTVLQVGTASPRSDRGELAIVSLSGNSVRVPAAFANTGRTVGVSILCGSVWGYRGATALALPLSPNVATTAMVTPRRAQ